jgi:hypothetical protein
MLESMQQEQGSVFSVTGWDNEVFADRTGEGHRNRGRD